MAALVCHGMLLHLHKTRSSRVGSPQWKRNSKPLGGSNLGFHGFGSLVHGRSFLRIGQIQGKELQVVAMRAEEEEEKEMAMMDAVGFGLVKGVVQSVLEAVCSVQKPAMVALLFCLLVSQGPEMAVAASGGRVGGSSFKSYYSYSLRDSLYCSHVPVTILQSDLKARLLTREF